VTVHFTVDGNSLVYYGFGKNWLVGDRFILAYQLGSSTDMI